MKRVSQAVIAALGLALAGTAFAWHDDDDDYTRSRDAYTTSTMRVRNAYFDYAPVVQVQRVVMSENSEPATTRECWKEPRDEYRPGATYRDDNEQPNVVYSGEAELRRTAYRTRTIEEHCQTRTEYQPESQSMAYDVVFRYDGQDYHERMSHPPGSRVRVHVDNGYVELAE